MSLAEGIQSLDPRVQVILLTRAKEQRARQRQIVHVFPDTGPFARDKYPKSLEFFKAGAAHRERVFLGGNRTSKTKSTCYEDVLHLTGLYDRFAPWWEGKRFDHPVKMWVWGDSDEKVKETVQEELLGPVGAWGTGLLPGEYILGTPERAASPIRDLVDTVRVQHVSGGISTLQFKSYKQGRKAAEGTFQDVVHGDEEMPLDIYTECGLRTMDTTGTGTGNGILYLSFTPLQGLSDTVLQFMPEGELPQGKQTGSKYVVSVSWDDVPHLDEATKAEMLSLIPPFQRDARTRGLPVLGAGVIYPVPEEDYLVEPFPLPKHWLRAYALDVGWNRTAALWGAFDAESDTWYLYHEHYRGQAEPSVHAQAIKGPGEWIRGVIDPAARGRSQADGEQLIRKYRDLGLHLVEAQNSVETGLYECWERLSTGRLKVFSSLSNWRKECRLYRRDEKGRIVRSDDHLLDAMRYLILSGKPQARAVPVAKKKGTGPESPVGPYAWMG